MGVAVIRYTCIYLCATIVFLALLTSSAFAGTYVLELARVIAFGEFVEVDSYLFPDRPRGGLVIHTDDRNIITDMRFDAWYRGDLFEVEEEEPLSEERLLVSDSVVALDHSSNGARYEVFSLADDRVYYITFVRRAPPDEGFDPAIIFIVRAEPDLRLQLDYRYLP